MRDLRLALNASSELPREAVCRLARDADRWLPAKRGSHALARELCVPTTALERAFELRSKASEIARRERESAAALGVSILVLGEEGYPAPLLDLALPPPVLFVRGELLDQPAIAIVGSRRMDAYGREVATLFARHLAQAGLQIVSGFAHGVDATAHRAALEVPGGRTVAVLGCGHGVDYPRGHRRLGEEIAASGALVSEFPCGREPTTWSFPIRNGIVAQYHRF